MNRPASFRGMATTLCVLLYLGACERAEEIRVYRSPKDRMNGEARTATPARAAAPVAAELEWDVPEGWTQQPGTDGVRLATISRGGVGHGASVSVVKLGAQAGGLLANVNRWRNQLGLTPIDEGGLADCVRSLDGAGVPVRVVDLLGPAPAGGEPQQRMLGAVVETADATWFFKAVGSRNSIDAAEPELLALFRSIHAGEPSPAAQGTQGSGLLPPAPPVASLTFTAPPGWREDATPRAARAATLLNEGDASVEIAVTQFPGDVGGELANVNRWRSQLGLAPAATLEGEQASATTIGGAAARIYRFAAPGEAPDRPGIIVALASHSDSTWFFKMTGPIAALDTQVPAFTSFVESVRFADQ